MSGRVVLAVVALAALSLVAGTGGTTSVTADRGVTVAVADDPDALLAIEYGAVDNETREISLTNRVTAGSLNVTVDVESGDATATLDAGETAVFAVRCNATARIDAVGDDVAVETTRHVPCS